MGRTEGLLRTGRGVLCRQHSLLSVYGHVSSVVSPLCIYIENNGGITGYPRAAVALNLGRWIALGTSPSYLILSLSQP